MTRYRLHSAIQLFTAFILILFSTACHKDSDDVVPVVSITKPAENTFFNVNDTIEIRANVSDDKQISSIEITLTNSEFIPVLRSYVLPVHSNPEDIYFTYPLDDKFMESGNYNILVKVSDGTNVKHKYRAVKIAGIPRKFTGLGLVTKTNNALNISHIDTNWNNNFLYSVPGDFSGAAYLSYHNRFVTAPYFYKTTEVYDFFLRKKEWTVESKTPTSFPSFTGVETIGKHIFLMYYEGRIERYDYSGRKDMTLLCLNGFQPVKIIKAGNYYIVWQKKQTQPYASKIEVYQALTGASIQSYTVGFEMVDMFDAGDGKILIFGNDNGNGTIKIYHMEDNAFSSPHILPPGKIVCAVFTVNEEYLFVQDGDLEQYFYKPNTLHTVKAGANFTIMKYDPVSGYLFVKNNNFCEAHTYPDLIKRHTVAISGELLDFEIIYNL
jgi:hypothetical protein